MRRALRAEGRDVAAVLEEQRNLVRVDGQLTPEREILIGVLVDDLLLLGIWRAIIIRCTPPLTKSMMPMLDSLHAVPAARYSTCCRRPAALAISRSLTYSGAGGRRQPRARLRRARCYAQPISPAMHSDIELETLPAPVQRVLSKEAPGPVKLMAARGVLPGAKPGDIVTVVSVLAESEDPKLSELARATLSKLPPADLARRIDRGSAGQRDSAAGSRLSESARGGDLAPAHAAHRPRGAGNDGRRCRRARGRADRHHEELMLKNPTVIEKLYLNKRVRMSTADRLVELAVRHNLELNLPAFAEAAQAIKNELILEAAEEPYFDDLLFKEANHLGELLKIDEIIPTRTKSTKRVRKNQKRRWCRCTQNWPK